MPPCHSTGCIDPPRMPLRDHVRPSACLASSRPLEASPAGYYGAVSLHRGAVPPGRYCRRRSCPPWRCPVGPRGSNSVGSSCWCRFSFSCSSWDRQVSAHTSVTLTVPSLFSPVAGEARGGEDRGKADENGGILPQELSLTLAVDGVEDIDDRVSAWISQSTLLLFQAS